MGTRQRCLQTHCLPVGQSSPLVKRAVEEVLAKRMMDRAFRYPRTATATKGRDRQMDPYRDLYQG